MFVYYYITVLASQALLPLCVPIYAASAQFRSLTISEVKRERRGDLHRLNQLTGEMPGSHSQGFSSTRAVGFQLDSDVMGPGQKLSGLTGHPTSSASVFLLPFPRITTQRPYDVM